MTHSPHCAALAEALRPFIAGAHKRWEARMKLAEILKAQPLPPPPETK